MVKSNLLLIFLLQGKKFTHQPGVISVHILLRLSSDGVGPALPSALLGSLCTVHSICHVMRGVLHHLQSCWTLCTVHSICQVTGWECVQFTPSVRWQGGNCAIFSLVELSVYVSLHLSCDRVGTAPPSILLNSLCTFHSTFQVTGRVLKGGDVAGLEDIMALPVLTSSARCPEFDFRMTINSGRQKANPEMLLLLRVYTVDIITEQVTVIGSCLIKVFDNSKKKVCLLGSTWGYFGWGDGGGGGGGGGGGWGFASSRWGTGWKFHPLGFFFCVTHFMEVVVADFGETN